MMMKRFRIYIAAVLFSLCLLAADSATAQCSICTKTAQQLGEKPAKGLNAGILYLAFAPLALIGFIGYKWYNKEKQSA